MCDSRQQNRFNLKAAYQETLQLALKRKSQYRKLAQEILKKKNQAKVDELFHELHDAAFLEIDCLECANCCKTTGPLWTSKDVERAAKALNMRPGIFQEKFLRLDEDGDYVLQQVPCTFLGKDHYCSIYAARPEACRDYPHTHRPQMRKIMKICVENTQICPAVAYIFENLESRLSCIK